MGRPSPCSTPPSPTTTDVVEPAATPTIYCALSAHQHRVLMDSYAKRRIAIRYWLLGAGYYRAVAAMEYAAGFHTGTRRDNVTPEFAHQVAIASFVRTQASALLFPEDAIAVAFLHDVREDYDVADAEIRDRFGDRVADAVDAMTKVFRGVRRDDADQFARMALDPVASVVKAADRIHNQDTMVGVFSPAKIASYVEETTTFFLPMIKAARRNFPVQDPAYENSKAVLSAQLNLLAHLKFDAHEEA